MTPVLVVVVTVVAVVVAGLGLASTLAHRRIGQLHLAGAALLELVLLTQAVLVVAALVGGRRPADIATFLSYLTAVVLVPVAGVLWARTEPSRWAGTVLAVAAAVVAVMVWRLLQLWEVAGA